MFWRSHGKGGSFSGDSVVVEVPSVVHHELEVVVTVDAHGNVVVVLAPLRGIDISVFLVLSFLHSAVVLLEGVKEFHEDLIFSLVTSDDAGVFLGVVSLSDVVDVEDAGAVLVEDSKSFHGEVSSELVHFTSDSTKELLVVDGAITISIEDIEKSLAVGFSEADTEIVEGLHALFAGQSSGSVVISDSESSADSLDSAGATLGKLRAELVDNVLIAFGLNLIGFSLGREVSNNSFVAISNCISVFGGGLTESGLGSHHGRVKSILTVITSSSLSALDGRRRTRLGLHASVGSYLLVVVSASNSTDLRTLGSPGVSALASSIHVPGRVHHRNEVVISVNAAGDVGIVLHEFFTSYSLVILRSCLAVVVSFECLEPFTNHLLGGHSSCHNFRVFVS